MATCIATTKGFVVLAWASDRRGARRVLLVIVLQDIIGEVSPSASGSNPDELCQVCNALESTSVATSAALLWENATCDDGDLCTYNDHCNVAGQCMATEYPVQTCLIGEEFGNDPTMDCEVRSYWLVWQPIPTSQPSLFGFLLLSFTGV